MAVLNPESNINTLCSLLVGWQHAWLYFWRNFCLLLQYPWDAHLWLQVQSEDRGGGHGAWQEELWLPALGHRHRLPGIKKSPQFKDTDWRIPEDTCWACAQFEVLLKCVCLLHPCVCFLKILTQEDWNMVLYNGMASTSPCAALYFVALMTFGNYVLFNLLVAILVEGFQAEVIHNICRQWAMKCITYSFIHHPKYLEPQEDFKTLSQSFPLSAS